MLHGKHLAGPGEAGLHLVGNQQNSMLVAQRAQPFHGRLLDHIETTLPLNRLKHNGSHAGGFDVTLEQVGHGSLGLVQGRAMARERQVINFRWKRTEASLVGLHLASQRNSKQAAPMKSAAKCNHATPTRGRAGDLDGVFDGLSAGRKEGCLFGSIYRRDVHNALGQGHILRIGHDLVTGVGEAL